MVKWYIVLGTFNSLLLVQPTIMLGSRAASDTSATQGSHEAELKQACRQYEQYTTRITELPKGAKRDRRLQRQTTFLQEKMAEYNSNPSMQLFLSTQLRRLGQIVEPSTSHQTTTTPTPAPRLSRVPTDPITRRPPTPFASPRSSRITTPRGSTHAVAMPTVTEGASASPVPVVAAAALATPLALQAERTDDAKSPVASTSLTSPRSSSEPTAPALVATTTVESQGNTAQSWTDWAGSWFGFVSSSK